MAHLVQEKDSGRLSHSERLAVEKGKYRAMRDLWALVLIVCVAVALTFMLNLSERIAGLVDNGVVLHVATFLFFTLLGLAAFLGRRLVVLRRQLRVVVVSGGSEKVLDSAEEEANQKSRSQMEIDLRAAIDLESLVLHYQPLFSVNDQKLLGFEALLRWQHAERGSVSPLEFIPLAEEAGLIVQLGEWVLEQACKDALRWSGERKIAVNLSPLQLQDSRLPTRIADILRGTGFPAHRLELEITENALTENADKILEILLKIKKLGVKISMDDFGTGYSSLSYLQRFPFDKIKIDRSIISQLEQDGEDTAVLRAMLAMGRSMGLVATAEGVESAEQFDSLQMEGCDEVQGFLLGRPMPFEYAMALSSVPDPVVEELLQPWASHQHLRAVNKR